MTPATDSELLLRYAETRDNTAFALVVGRHLDAVYSAALRRAGGDTHLAEDIAQQVFLALARQSRALATHPHLTAWLYATTRNHAANAVRAECRRKTREAEASAMNENEHFSPAASADWSQLPQSSTRPSTNFPPPTARRFSFATSSKNPSPTSAKSSASPKTRPA
jgi:DNA-directed RNA polymerase specialized sigma24 family protein